MKKIIISEEEKKRILNLYLYELDLNLYHKNLISESFSIVYRANSTYPAGGTDPSLFIDDYVKNLVAKIDADAEAGNLRKSANGIYCSFIRVGSGASNSWGSNATGYDLENNLRTKVTPTETVLYQKNLDLSLKRAKIFETKLFEKLKPFKVFKDPSLTKVMTESYVVNTGGKNDKDRDTSLYPNTGQFINCQISLKSKDELTNIIYLKDYTEITPKMVSTGSYFCDGTNSQGKSAKPDFYDEQCPQSTRNNKNKLAAFEIKWNPNVMKNTYTVPLARWNFYWSKDGSKISKITRQQYNNTTAIDRKFPPESNVAKDDVVLKYMMGISEGNTVNGGQRYAKYVAPY